MISHLGRLGQHLTTHGQHEQAGSYATSTTRDRYRASICSEREKIMKKFILVSSVLILILTSCNSVDDIDSFERVEQYKEEIVKLNQKVDQLEEEIELQKVLITEIEKNQDVQNDIEINTNFVEDKYQEITGVKVCDSSVLMLTPYTDSIDLGAIEDDEVKVIATGMNDLQENWAIVEVLSRLGEIRYGYVKSEDLSEGVSGKHDYDAKNVEISLDTISIGDNMEAVINRYGHDYYVVKDSNAYQIGYNTDDQGGHIVFTIDSRVLRVRGMRTTSNEYKLDNGIGVGMPWTSIYDVYSEDEIINNEGHYFIDANDGFIISIQLNSDKQTDEATISRIDIEYDWGYVFK